MKKNDQTTFSDYLLVIVACTTSLFALGMSLGKTRLAAFLSIGAGVSLLLGFAIAPWARRTKLADYDGYIWAGLAFLAAVLSPLLNRALPEDGFPYMLFAGTWLSWIVLLCGVVSWRDQTLLFLNLPCISVFALVGTFDNFPPATLLFFLFLVCSSLLYARIHRRSMVRRAEQLGVEDPSLLERDAWRWMAGPEWAFASAAVIVCVSILGAPVLRFSLQNVSGAVRVSLPQQTPTSTSSMARETSNDVSVGRGPVSLDDSPVFKVKVDRADFLRGTYYTEYSGSGWSRPRLIERLRTLGLESKSVSHDPADPKSRAPAVAWPGGPPLERIPDAERAVAVLSGPSFAGPALFSPGPILSVKGNTAADYLLAASGFGFRRQTLGRGETVDIEYQRPAQGGDFGPSSLSEPLRSLQVGFVNPRRIPQDVRNFARSAVAGARSDYERALLLKQAIERTASYTLKAPALAPSRDVVSQFLFETKVGYCDLFATSMAVCARAVGLPSRYVTGYLVGDPNRDAQGFFTVRQRDAHAWAEVYFANKGWVAFDATEGAPVLDSGEGGKDGVPWYARPWAQVLIGVVSLAAAFLVGRALWSEWGRFRLGARRVSRPMALLLHREFDRILRAKTGLVRKFSMTTTEYVTAVAPRIGDSAPLARAIADRLESACYGKAGLTAVEVEETRRQLKALGRIPRSRGVS